MKSRNVEDWNDSDFQRENWRSVHATPNKPGAGATGGTWEIEADENTENAIIRQQQADRRNCGQQLGYFTHAHTSDVSLDSLRLIWRDEVSKLTWGITGLLGTADRPK